MAMDTARAESSRVLNEAKASRDIRCVIASFLYGADDLHVHFRVESVPRQTVGLEQVARVLVVFNEVAPLNQQLPI